MVNDDKPLFPGFDCEYDGASAQNAESFTVRFPGGKAVTHFPDGRMVFTVAPYPSGGPPVSTTFDEIKELSHKFSQGDKTCPSS